MHTPSHIDNSHWGGEPSISGAGSPHTYSAAHPRSDLETTRSASSSLPASSSSSTAQHPAFTKAEAEHPPSGGSHAGEAFSSFGPGQPPATGPSAYGGGILKDVSPSSSHHLSAAPMQHRGESDPFHPDEPSSTAAKVESAAAKLGSTSSPSTSHEHGHHHYEHSTTSSSPSLQQQSQPHGSTSASSPSQGTGVGGLKYTNPVTGTTTPASPQTAMPKPESQHPHSASSSSAPSHGAQAASSTSTAAGRGAPLASSTSKADESASSSHGTPAWVNKASDERKAEYPTHEPAAAPSSSTTSNTTGSSAQQSHGAFISLSPLHQARATLTQPLSLAADTHKPTLKERVKDVFHHSSAH